MELSFLILATKLYQHFQNLILIKKPGLLMSSKEFLVIVIVQEQALSLW